MTFEEDVEARVKAVMSDPTNQCCSECERPEYRDKPVWAAFMECPVDQRKLGVVCCKKCYKLFTKVEGVDFTTRNLKEFKDWTEEDIDALELGGNKLVNICYEATVTNEKDGRDKRKYGYEAFFFEKYVNLTHFDEVLYRQLIYQASKALVEKRFNSSYRGFNLKKPDEDDPNEGSLSSLEFGGVEDFAAAGGRRGDMKRATDPRGLQNRRQTSIANRRRHQSARNLVANLEQETDDGNGGRQKSIANRRRLHQSAGNLKVNLDEEKDDEFGGGNSRPSLSRHRMNSRSNVKDISGGNGISDANGRTRRSQNRRAGSARNLTTIENRSSSHRRVSHEERRGVRRTTSDSDNNGEEMRRSSSARRLQVAQGNDRGNGREVRRSSSARRLRVEDGKEMRRSSSNRKLRDAHEVQERHRGNTRNGRHRLLA